MNRRLLRLLFSGCRVLFFCGLIGVVAGCVIDDLPRRGFPNCTKPSAKIGSAARLLDVSFTLEDTTGTISNVVWSFGDGGQATTGAITTRHVFTTPGTYKVSAKLTNACGDEVAIDKEVIVDNTVPPLVSTLGFLDPNVTTVTLRMQVDNNGNGKISRYGICYSPEQGIPTIINSLTVGVDNDLAPGSPVSFTVGQLVAATPYYFRGFATNNSGTGYGSVISVVTSTPPVVNTIGASLVGTTTASVTFLAVNTGSPPATKYGICYSISTNAPTVGSPGSLTASIDAPVIGTNTTLALTNLVPDMTYYYRAFAISAANPVPVYSANTLTFRTQSAIDLTTGLIATYSFDGNGLDASGNNNNGTLVNNAGFGPDRTGKANAALQLDGIDDYFDIPDAPSLRPATISVSVWIKPATLTRIMQIYNKSNFNTGTGEQYSSLIKPSLTGGVTINVDIKQDSRCGQPGSKPGDGWRTSTFDSTTPINTWHHLVAVFEGNVARLYFDTAQLADDKLPFIGMDNCPGGSLKFGAQSRGFENYFHGSIDDVRIYSRALTAAQVEALFRQ